MELLLEVLTELLPEVLLEVLPELLLEVLPEVLSELLLELLTELLSELLPEPLPPGQWVLNEARVLTSAPGETWRKKWLDCDHSFVYA